MAGEMLFGTVTEVIDRFISSITDANPNSDPAVILIGSVARGTATAHSDLDLLLVSEQRLKCESPAEQFHVQEFTLDQFIAKLSGGDDFAAWCVRYGVPIRLAPVWKAILQSEEATRWPEWRLKITHTTRRLLLAR